MNLTCCSCKIYIAISSESKFNLKRRNHIIPNISWLVSQLKIHIRNIYTWQTTICPLFLYGCYYDRLDLIPILLVDGKIHMLMPPEYKSKNLKNDYNWNFQAYSISIIELHSTYFQPNVWEHCTLINIANYIAMSCKYAIKMFHFYKWIYFSNYNVMISTKLKV